MFLGTTNPRQGGPCVALFPRFSSWRARSDAVSPTTRCGHRVLNSRRSGAKLSWPIYRFFDTKNILEDFFFSLEFFCKKNFVATANRLYMRTPTTYNLRRAWDRAPLELYLGSQSCFFTQFVDLKIFNFLQSPFVIIFLSTTIVKTALKQ